MTTTIAEALTTFRDKHHPKDVTLPTSTRMFRIKMILASLKSGTPLNRLEHLMEVFDENGSSLTSHSHMREESTTISKERMGAWAHWYCYIAS